jgi:hypothetical protein
LRYALRDFFFEAAPLGKRVELLIQKLISHCTLLRRRLCSGFCHSR